MKLVLTAEEILERGCWDKFCELRGINPYAMNEGLMDSREEFTFSPDEYEQIFGCKPQDIVLS